MASPAPNNDQGQHKETRMTALPNVTYNSSRRGSQRRRGSLIDETQKDRLATNRSILLKNVKVTDRLLEVCQDKSVITVAQRQMIEQVEDDDDKKMELLMNTINLNDTGVFTRFCDALTISGHPLIADYLRDSAFAAKTFNFDDMWEQLPTLNKNLHKWEKERLTTYITNKVKEEAMRFNMGDIQEERGKEMDIRLKQVEQSWKFQREIKDKDGIVAQLRSRIEELEHMLIEKDQATAADRHHMQRDIEKLSSNVQVATKFNMANDNAIRRMQEFVNLYKGFVQYLDERLDPFKPVKQRVMPPPGTMVREETSLEEMHKEFDLGHQLDFSKQLVENALKEIENLREVQRRYETLVESVQFVRQQIRSSDSDPVNEDQDNNEQSENYSEILHRSFVTFSLRNNDLITRYRAEIDLLNRFIHGLLEREEVPEHLTNVQIPSEERDALIEKISDLEAELEKTRNELRERPVIMKSTLAPVGLTPLPTMQEHHSEGGVHPTPLGSPVTPFSRHGQLGLPPPSNPTTTHSTYPHLRTVQPIGAPRLTRLGNPPPNIPFSYHSRRVPREAKPRPDPKPPNAKILTTRVVNFL